MTRYLLTFLLVCVTFAQYAQKDSLRVGDRYADDQVYFAINYAQLHNQPTNIARSRFSYGVSAGFMKDIILNKQGSLSIALGIGYGFDYYNQNLKITEVNNTTIFDSFLNGESGVFKAHNLELPIELRWRTSTANKYKFWRIYPGIKFLYNTKNEFITETADSSISFENVTAYNTFQYGVSLSVGYDLFNLNLFYNLTNLFENATFQGQNIETSTLKFGLMFYIL